jgi:hypothetical protein
MLMTSSNLELRFFIFVFICPLLREALRLFSAARLHGGIKIDLGCGVAVAERRNGFGSGCCRGIRPQLNFKNRIKKTK